MSAAPTDSTHDDASPTFHDTHTDTSHHIAQTSDWSIPAKVTAAQRECIQAVRVKLDALAATRAPSASTATATPAVEMSASEVSAYIQHWVDAACVIRYLRAHKWHVDAATTAIRNTVVWRIKEKVCNMWERKTCVDTCHSCAMPSEVITRMCDAMRCDADAMLM